MKLEFMPRNHRMKTETLESWRKGNRMDTHETCEIRQCKNGGRPGKIFTMGWKMGLSLSNKIFPYPKTSKMWKQVLKGGFKRTHLAQNGWNDKTLLKSYVFLQCAEITHWMIMTVESFDFIWKTNPQAL